MIPKNVIALSYIAGGGVPPSPAPLFAYATPTTIGLSTSNGTYITNPITCNVEGGTEPYTYEWESDNPSVTLSATDEAAITARLSGFNELVDANLTCTVTDDVSDTYVVYVAITVTFGNEGVIL